MSIDVQAQLYLNGSAWIHFVKLRFIHLVADTSPHPDNQVYLCIYHPSSASIIIIRTY